VEGEVVQHEPVPGERTGQPYQADPRFPRTKDFRSAPKVLQRNPPLQLKGNVGTRPEPAWKSAKPDDDFSWPDNYKGGAKTLTKNDNGGANYSAEDLAALKQKHGISINSPVSNASTKLVKVSKDIIGERTAEPRTPGEPLQHGFNPKPAEDLGLKIRSDVAKKVGTGGSTRLKKRIK
jgi:hypothetical protein